jgi:hypothetical protein
MAKPPTIEEALAGEHGIEFQKIAQDAVNSAAQKLGEMFGDSALASRVSKEFAKGGVVKASNFQLIRIDGGETVIPNSSTTRLKAIKP